MLAWQLATCLTLFLCCTSCWGQVTCMDEAGKPVDWFFIYKMPSGFKFAYRDSNDKSFNPLHINAELLNRTSTGALGATLHQLYEGKKQTSLAYALWNDGQPYKPQSQTSNPSSPPHAHAEHYDDSQAPMDDGFYADNTGKLHSSSSVSGGHTKGVLAVSGTGGFYLLHSVPKFPDLRTPEFTWEASTIYAQHFLCITVNNTQADRLAHHLQHVNAMLFDWHLPEPLSTQYPSMAEFVAKIRRAGTSVVQVTTPGGWVFRAFAKDSSWGGDLYEDLVEPVLGQGFAWQTWRRANGEGMVSYCSPPHQHDSMNVAAMQFPGPQPTDKPERFEFTKDHSKWGLTVDDNLYSNTTGSEKEWVCMGDLNRMVSQRKRGGGTMCIQWPQLRRALSASLAGVEPCTI